MTTTADSDIHRTLIAHQLICPVAEQEHQPVQAPEQTGCRRRGLLLSRKDMIATTSSTAPPASINRFVGNSCRTAFRLPGVYPVQLALEMAIESPQRAAWIRKAQIAVGIPQGNMQRFCLDPTDSSIKLCMKMIAPKAQNIFAEEQPDVIGRRRHRAQAVAYIARQRAKALFRRPSAIGASSGRTICGCPPRLVNPRAAVASRTNR